MASDRPSRLYDAYYFAHGCGEPYQRSEIWLTLFNSFAERIQRDINPASVLDAGCAMGFLVETLRQRGVEAWGVDISAYAIGQLAPQIQPYCWLGSVTEPFPRTYDLIVSIEVLEHLSPQQAEQAVENLCRHSEDILFSSTPFDYKEVSHFNVQPPEYWAELFARLNFFRDVDFDASFITPWAVRFRRKQEPLHRLVRDYERRFWQLWKENTDLRALSLDLRDELAALTQASPGVQPTEGPLNPDREAGWSRNARRFVSKGWRALLRKLRLPPASRSENPDRT
ncbi:MAG TPA: class I SAM-dependent methyltransferase [Anaerolineales bacterium]|nr:class I SAM-dependent methyltransferase [Anaerolineales bacterium]